ncbi:MAG: CDF family Co(II)/Ni(II) efflux transporter DmeF [Chloroflexales bacterium]|nr:CDF family Co(II)/Ni(II) efflux transporter DmeF [Chloroflexales bacterium]
MHIHTLYKWQHSHQFSIDQGSGEKNTRLVVMLTAVMMVIEITAGLAFGSIALLADGWHMGTHVAALGITLFAYRYARRYANDPRYSFGTGKVGALGGFASAIALVVVAVLMGLEAIESLFVSRTIHFDEAISVAVVGLIVNLFSAYLLRGQDHHHHDHHSDHHDHHSGHHDHNLRAAYLHVLADTMTSLFAIVALLAGKSLGWVWLDSVMGIVGAVVITSWSYNLLRITSSILLDSGVNVETVSAIRSTIEADADNRVADIHVWQIAPEHLAVIISIVTHYPQPINHYKNLLRGFQELDHITVEINHCTGEPCLPYQTPVES